ncbi:sensor histidine kinase [Niveispirillum fermenti]|uniref:sensor histidine kinase n=1 Tax=Niveispirillum fermenti TaxID=1233113 RepID=UPI003A83A518
MSTKDGITTILVAGGRAAYYPAPAPLERLTPPAALRFLRVGDTPLSACRAIAPTLLVLDMACLDDPLAVVADIRAAGLPVEPGILLIGDAIAPGLRVRALELGALEAMDRPGEIDELQARLLAHAHRQQRLMTAEQTAAERACRLTEVLELLKRAERKLLTQGQEPAATEVTPGIDTLSRAAHELRTPLHAILGFAELIRDAAHGPHADPRYGDYAIDIHQAATHLLALVDGTLDLARVEAGAETLNIRDIDIGRTVQDSARMLWRLAEGSGITLDVNIPQTPLRIRTDPEKVRQIVLNLASNAIKFTPRGGRVTVEVNEATGGGAVILVIRDTGIGIAAQDLPTAMKPFGQVRQADKPHPKGTGLGLPLTRRFVEMLGGTLDIDTAPGIGTVISVRLPASTPERRTPTS